MKVNFTIGIPVWFDRICVWPVLTYRKHRYGFPFRKIPLGDSLFTIVDPDVFYCLNKFHWVGKQEHNLIYAIRFARKDSHGSTVIRMHREILNAPKGLLVDHRNNNSLDNRRANLRLANAFQNSCNKSKTRSQTSSKYIGVTFNKWHRKWEARISFQNKIIWLGYFDSEIDAALAYDAAAKIYHGEFAHLNFPEVTTPS
jgi:hypothetical protein